LERDSRTSLLVAEGGSADPLANGRVTMLGPCTRVGEDGGRARAAFFAVHPNATYYADFRDFTFWKLHVDYVRYIGAMAGCRGSARPTGGPPNRIPSLRRPPT
jgi:hypothetical protein